MKISKQEQDELTEMTLALSEFLMPCELDEILKVFNGLVRRLKVEDNKNGNIGREDQKNY